MRIIVAPNPDQEKKKSPHQSRPKLAIFCNCFQTVFLFCRHKVVSKGIGPRWGLPSNCHSIHLEPSVESVGIFVNDVG